MPDYIEEARSLFEYTRLLRRDFHMHPELGFQEVRTAGIVTRELNALGLEVTAGVGKTGVIALIEGERPGPTVMLRADMDALPIQEQTGAEYASQNPGVMHACGHDAHTAIMLTVARLLQEHRRDLSGTVKLIFQPAEEGLGGAESMVADGVLENPKPDWVLGLHVWNDRPVGWYGIVPGPFMAAADIFHVRITGKGGHAAQPHLTADPVAASAQVISALQTITSRNVSPLETAVVSVTMVHGGDAFNVIPSEVELQGTIRTFEPVIRETVIRRFNEIVTGVSSAMGCQGQTEIRWITPAVINNPQLAEEIANIARQLFPGEKVDTSFRTMGSEDFSVFMQNLPGCYFFVGSANPDRGLDFTHHHPRFDIDEEVLPRAAGLMASVAAQLLQGKG
jgi:amidohydrolase